MMPTAASTASDRSLTDEFIDLVCADPALVDAEFAAIVATEWPQGPRVRGRGAARGVGAGRPRMRDREQAPPPLRRHHGEARPHERSPPGLDRTDRFT
jgi:hypothetical protein